MTDPDAPLNRLVGQRLSSVTFLLDYVQFDFNGPRLSAFVWPFVDAFGQELRLGDAGYRDGIVALVGRDVAAVQDAPEAGVVVRFQAGTLTINPELSDLQGPEIAMLQMNDDTGVWDIWRPGEGSFAARGW